MQVYAHCTFMHAHIAPYCEYTLDPPEQLSFSSSSTNSALFRSYLQIQKCACTIMCIVLACVHILLQKSKNLSSEYTLDPLEQLSFSSSSPNSALCKSCYQTQKHTCMFMHIALACMQILLQQCEIVVSIHRTLLSNFHFLHHPQILHCLEAIAKYRNVHAP